jgi:hypothetical protein
VLLFFIPFALFAQSADSSNWHGGLFEIGRNYFIWQYRANIRSEPTINSEVIAILSINDKIEIVENTFITEQINDIWGYWVKIKFGRIIGYTFSGNIASSTLVVDIDNNGVNDYFHYRKLYEKSDIYTIGSLGYSLHGPGFFTFDRISTDSRKDIIISINNKLLSTEVLKRRYDDGTIVYDNDRVYLFDYCIFENYNDYVLIGLINHGRHTDELVTAYKVDRNGIIEYFGSGNLSPW